MADDLFDHEADVLVVGSGGAAFSAAVTAAAEGASVIMFERNEHIGGTTGASGGTAWIPNNSSLRSYGVEDGREDAIRYMCRMSFPQHYSAGAPMFGVPRKAYELIETHYDTGSQALDYLTAAGVLDLTAEDPRADEPIVLPFSGNVVKGFPDYGANLAEDKVPRGRHIGPTPGTPSMVEQFETGARKLGVDIRLEHQAHALLRNDDGAVVGLELRYRHLTVIARARKAVVFASGGFAHDPERVKRHLPGRVFGSCATLGAEGDFIEIAGAAGAAIAGLNGAWWKQVVVEAALWSASPPGVWLPWDDAMFQVNKYGHRVVNEKMPYHDRGQVHSVYDPTRREFPNSVLFMIYDDTVARSDSMEGMRRPLPMPDEETEYVITGETWSDLAARIDAKLAELGDHVGGVRLDADFETNLAETVRRFDGFAREGKDLDFGRGDAPLDRAWSGPNREGSANPTLAPFAGEGPYHCIIVGAGILDTNGGPVINTAAQVVDVHDQPIPGLYGAGNCVATPAGQGYWGPGATIGLGLTFGHIAGRGAAAEADKDF